MRESTSIVAILLGLGLAGCCCPERAAGTSPSVARGRAAPARQYLIVRCTILKAKEGHEEEVLLEGRVIAVPGHGPIAALAQARRLDESRVPVWLAGSEVSDAAFGAHAERLAMPSLVTRSGEEAVISIGESDGAGGVETLTELRASPTLREGGVELRLTYTHLDHGVRVFAIPAVTLRAPERRVFIVEALGAVSK